MKWLIGIIVAVLIIIVLSSEDDKDRAKLCVESQTYKLLDQGYSADEAKLGSVINCSKEIELAIQEEKTAK